MSRFFLFVCFWLFSCSNIRTEKVHTACVNAGIPCLELRGADRDKLIDANQYRDDWDRLAGPQYQLQFSPDDCARDQDECVRLVREFAACLRGERACPRTGLILW
jgi:hypothetical protein